MLIGQQSVYRDKYWIAFCYHKYNGMQIKLYDVLYVVLIRIPQRIRLNILRYNTLVGCKHISCLIKFDLFTIYDSPMEMVKIICLTLRWIGGWRYERMKVDEYEVATEKEVLNSDMERYKKFKYYINWKFFFLTLHSSHCKQLS